jgi:zinc protease
VGRFAGDEFTGWFQREPNYYQTYRSRVEAVTREDVQRVARKHLDPTAIRVLVVGNKEDILKGDDTRPVKLTDLTAGRIVDVPLRDPLTMKPMVPSAAASTTP